MVLLGFSSGTVSAAAMSPIERKIAEARQLCDNIPNRIAIISSREYSDTDRRDQVMQCAADIHRLKVLNLGFFDPKYPAKVARLERAFEDAFLFSE